MEKVEDHSERERRIWDRPRKSHWPIAYINSWACRATSFRLPGIKSQADVSRKRMLRFEIWEGSSHMITTTQARSENVIRDDVPYELKWDPRARMTPSL